MLEEDGKGGMAKRIRKSQGGREKVLERERMTE